jgi:hypothetical protein
MKKKNPKKHNVRTVPKSNRTIVERGKINTYHTLNKPYNFESINYHEK